jgi:translation initiation factor eIF-2B subunit epsilon
MLVNPAASTLMHYSQLPSLPRKHRFPIPTSLLMDRSDPRSIAYEVWGGKGYRDLGIDVCEADVPALCTENFDWQDLRRHLVCGILSSQEMLGKKVGVYLVGGQNGESAEVDARESRTYVDRIRDTRTFGDVSRDVLRRWAYPLVPDSGIQGGSDFELRRGVIYVAREGVVLARTTSLIGPLLLGPYTSLGSNTTVRRSVLGRNNRVAAHSSICDAYLFDNVIIGKNCRVEGCILGEGVILEDGVTVEKGALLGSGVRVGHGQTVEAFARVGKTTAMTMKLDDSDEDSESEDIDGELAVRTLRRYCHSSPRFLGPGMIPLPGDSSVGYIWPTEDNEVESDDELDDPYEHPDNKRLLELGELDFRPTHDSMRPAADTNAFYYRTIP